MNNSNSLEGLVGNTNYELDEFESTTAYQFSQFLENQENGLYDDYIIPIDSETTDGLYDNSINSIILNDSATTIDIGDTTFEVQNIGVFNSSNSIDFVDGIEGSSHPDVYQFSLQRSNEVAITLDDLDADADLYVLNGNGEFVGFSDNPNFEAETLIGTLDAGTYFLGVVSYDGIDTDYSLSIQTGEFASAIGTDAIADTTYLESLFV